MCFCFFVYGLIKVDVLVNLHNKCELKMSENYPYLVSCKPLKPDHAHLSKINVTCEEFTLGRGLRNLAVIPCLSISRNHCIIQKNGDNEWELKDFSAFGIQVNGKMVGKGNSSKLSHEDEIVLGPLNEFIYKFMMPSKDELPRKRRKLNSSDGEDLINDVKTKFEESQSYEIRHLEEKINNTKQIQETTKMLKEQLQQDMSRKILQLENDFAAQIESLKGEKLEVEEHKAKLIEERDAQLAAVKEEMEGRITELMEQIQKHNETESDLLKENNQLKEKLLKEREDFLSELNKENSSKQDMLEKLEAKMREQEEIRLKEKQELEAQLKKETEEIRMAKEQELKELEEQKKLLEEKLVQELNDIKKNLADQVEQTEKERLEAQETLNKKVEQMKKMSDEEKLQMEQLLREKETMLKNLTEAEGNAEREMNELKDRIREREEELSALAVARIQQQELESGQVISSLQEQLAKTKSALQLLETEKNTLLESIVFDNPQEGTSKQAMDEVGELMESELQCSICAELFIVSTTLNCSHTFCKYCISMWKKKKKDCPICRAPITSECRSLVLDSFIEKVVQKSEGMRTKREELLKNREAEEAALSRPAQAARPARAQPTPTRRGQRTRNSTRRVYPNTATGTTNTTITTGTSATTTTSSSNPSPSSQTMTPQPSAIPGTASYIPAVAFGIGSGAAPNPIPRPHQTAPITSSHAASVTAVVDLTPTPVNSRQPLTLPSHAIPVAETVDLTTCPFPFPNQITRTTHAATLITGTVDLTTSPAPLPRQPTTMTNPALVTSNHTSVRGQPTTMVDLTTSPALRPPLVAQNLPSHTVPVTMTVRPPLVAQSLPSHAIPVTTMTTVAFVNASSHSLPSVTTIPTNCPGSVVPPSSRNHPTTVDLRTNPAPRRPLAPLPPSVAPPTQMSVLRAVRLPRGAQPVSLEAHRVYQIIQPDGTAILVVRDDTIRPTSTRSSNNSAESSRP